MRRFLTLFTKLRFLTLFSNLVCIFLLVVAMNVCEIYFPPAPEYPSHIHKTLFLDPKFSSAEKEDIILAAIEWSNATNHIVSLDVVSIPAPDDLMDQTSILVIRSEYYDPDIIIKDATSKALTLGLHFETDGLEVIKLVPERIANKASQFAFKTVVLHEIGHSLGLDHNEGLAGIGTLMSPFIDNDADHITHKDLVNFCKLYHCDANKLK